MLVLQKKQLPFAMRSYIGRLTKALVLEREGKPYIRIEPEVENSAASAFSELDAIVSRSTPTNFDYKEELATALTEKYEKL